MTEQIIIGAVIGVIVAIAGAITNYLIASSRDKERWKREDRIRGYEFRRDAYAKLLEVADRIVEGETGPEVFWDLKRAWWTAKLVRHSRQIVDTGDQLMVAMGLLATGNTSGLDPGWDPLAEFMTAAREDLGMRELDSKNL